MLSSGIASISYCHPPPIRYTGMTLRQKQFSFFITLLFVVGQFGHAEDSKKAAQVSTITTSEIEGFDSFPPKVQSIINYALELTTKELAYQFGSCDPKNGGMDCSGTVQHILTHLGYRAPRQSNTLYLWVRKNGNLYEVDSPRKITEEQMSHLKPGDLVFWEGTYNVNKRFPATSHVMIYIGKRKSDGKPLMVGASSGRSYQGKARHGVSIFDFRLPRSTSSAKFVGYGPVPGVKSLGRKLPPLVKPTESKKVDKPNEKEPPAKVTQPEVVPSKRNPDPPKPRATLSKPASSTPVSKPIAKTEEKPPNPISKPKPESKPKPTTKSSPTKKQTPPSTGNVSSSPQKKQIQLGKKARPFLKKLIKKFEKKK